MKRQQGASGKKIEPYFTKVPNEFLDQAAHFKLPKECWQCLMFIIRQSWGWNRKSVELRNKDIVKGTGLLPSNIARAIKRLQNDKIIDVIATDNKLPKKYRINYKYELSRRPEDLLSPEITDVIATDNTCYRYREQNVIATDNKDSLKVNAVMHSRRPKEIKENIKKNKESAKAKEPKKDSMASLCRKPMTEAEMVASAQRQKQALAEWEKSNSPG